MPLCTLKLLPVKTVDCLVPVIEPLSQGDGPHGAGPWPPRSSWPPLTVTVAAGGQGVGHAVLQRAAADGRAARVAVGGGEREQCRRRSSSRRPCRVIVPVIDWADGLLKVEQAVVADVAGHRAVVAGAVAQLQRGVGTNRRAAGVACGRR